MPTQDIAMEIAFLREKKELNLQMTSIFPADDPRVCTFTGPDGLRLRVDATSRAPAPTIRMVVSQSNENGEEKNGDAEGERTILAPGGSRFVLTYKEDLKLPAIETLVPTSSGENFQIRRLEDAPFIAGRAGMLYRDLVPCRVGGSMIASHIRIPTGGPVGDSVHFHRVRQGRFRRQEILNI